MGLITNSVSTKSRHHPKNEDSYICKSNYIIVADGMGGEACGDVASKITISVVSAWLDEHLKSMCSDDQIRDLAFRAIANADAEISNYIEAHPDADGMGSTIVLLIYKNDRLYVAWCGDSRCYHFSGSSKLMSITKDHSYVQQLIDQGAITIAESFTHPDNNLITHYVGGGNDTCVPEFTSVSLTDNEFIVLCSDGLSGYCNSEEIENEIRNTPFERLHNNLLNLALRSGSDDDITIVTIKLKKTVSKVRMISRLKALFGIA